MEPLWISLAELKRRAAALSRTRDECSAVARELTDSVAATTTGPESGAAAREVVAALAGWAHRIATLADQRAAQVTASATTYEDTDADAARGIAAGLSSWRRTR